jgi:hypothetical protein
MIGSPEGSPANALPAVISIAAVRAAREASLRITILEAFIVPTVGYGRRPGAGAGLSTLR